MSGNFERKFESCIVWADSKFPFGYIVREFDGNDADCYELSYDHEHISGELQHTVNFLRHISNFQKYTLNFAKSWQLSWAPAEALVGLIQIVKSLSQTGDGSDP